MPARNQWHPGAAAAPGTPPIRLKADATYEVRLKADTTYEVRLKADTTYSFFGSGPAEAGHYVR